MKSMTKRLVHYIWPYRARFLLAMLAMTVFGITDGLVPYILKRILDDVFGARDEGMLHFLVGFIVVFAIVRGVVGFFQRYLSATVGLDIVKDIRNEIAERLLWLSSSFYDKHSTGSLISRMTNDTLLVKTALTDAASALIRDSIRVVALLSAAIYLDPVLALIAFVGFPLGLIPVIKFGKIVRGLSRVGQEKFGDLTANMQEFVVGRKVVKTFTLEEKEAQRFSNENKSLTQTLIRAERYGALAGPTNEILGSLAIAGVIVYGGMSVISGVRTQGDFIAFLTAMFLLYEPLKKLSRINHTVQVGVGAAERIFEILDLEPEVVSKESARELVVDKPTIKYSGVSFRYRKESEEAEWTLRDVDCEVLPGDKVALVGPSGGGKSTFVSLLPRFYDPDEGGVFIDGEDIREFSLQSLRRQISMVDQHVFLFNDTVFENILNGRLDATREEVIEAAKAANAHEFIMGLPEQYDTEVGEQGLRLSGGQRARIAIARALLKNAPILILDEATASLDSESERLVQEALDKLMIGRSVLVIAHRFSTVRNADKILVVSKGRVVQSGTHDSLLQEGGEYKKLYELQFRSEEVGDNDQAERAIGG